MKNFLLTAILFLLWPGYVSAQFVATVRLENIPEGTCNPDMMYSVINGYDKQVEASCEISKNEILALLQEMEFLRMNPKFKTKGSVGLIINCKGEVLSIEANNKKSNEALNDQLVAVFKTLGPWKPGIVGGNDVDSYLIFSFEIKGGKITWPY